MRHRLSSARSATQPVLSAPTQPQTAPSARVSMELLTSSKAKPALSHARWEPSAKYPIFSALLAPLAVNPVSEPLSQSVTTVLLSEERTTSFSTEPLPVSMSVLMENTRIRLTSLANSAVPSVSPV